MKRKIINDRRKRAKDRFTKTGTSKYAAKKEQLAEQKQNK